MPVPDFLPANLAGSLGDLTGSLGDLAGSPSDLAGSPGDLAGNPGNLAEGLGDLAGGWATLHVLPFQGQHGPWTWLSQSLLTNIKQRGVGQRELREQGENREKFA